MTIRIAVLNLQSGVATTRGYWQYATTGWKYFLPHSSRPLESAGHMLRAQSINIALCTEVTESSLRSGFSSQVKTVQEASGIEHAQFFLAMKTFFAQEGSAILCKHPIIDAHAHPLTSGATPRILAQTTVRFERKNVRIFVAHLALSTKFRRMQIAEIASVLAAVSGPCIIGGDFNEPDPRAVKKITDLGFTDISLPNFPSWKPSRALDCIFTRGFEIQDFHIPQGKTFSDHLPLFATLRLV